MSHFKASNIGLDSKVSSHNSENPREQDKNKGFRPQDIKIIQKLGESNFPVYLISSSQSTKPYVMKLFFYKNDEPTAFYRREARFAGFNHQNLITINHFQNKTQFYCDNTNITTSYVIMEYARYGDFLTALTKYQIPFHDKLLRTYLHQLIEGLEYLHTNKAAHLDIKPENLLIADDYVLKIADFDLSHIQDDGAVVTMGTKNFRAPEVFQGTCQNPQAADIYSAGIVLFFLKTRGTLPYSEDPVTKGVDMAVLKEDDPELFWKNYCQFGDFHPSFFNEDFKALFLSMTKFDPENRATISQIKQSKWYNESVYTKEELAEFMSGRFDV